MLLHFTGDLQNDSADPLFAWLRGECFSDGSRVEIMQDLQFLSFSYRLLFVIHVARVYKEPLLNANAPAANEEI